MNLNVYEESEPWPSGAQLKDEYTKNPFEIAAYMQDKIEYNYLIVNIGLRFDYADPKATMWPDINRFGYFDENNNWVLAEEVTVDPKTQLSPRNRFSSSDNRRCCSSFFLRTFFPESRL